MKRAIFLLLIISSCSCISCHLFRHHSIDPVNIDMGYHTSGGAGTSYEDAVVVEEKNQTDGVAAEYDWLKTNYPGYAFISTSVNYSDNKPYDVMEIKTADGTVKKVYFDISGYFGKF